MNIIFIIKYCALNQIKLLKDKLITIFLEDMGYKVTALLSGIEAVETIKHQSFPLILMDIRMPKMNGIEALKQIRKNNRFSSVPAILFTTSSQPLDKKFAAEYKAGFITKPIDASQMKYIAETFIKHCKSE